MVKIQSFQHLGLLSTLAGMKVIVPTDSSSVAQSWTKVQQEVPFYHFRQGNPSTKEALPYFRLQLIFSIKTVSHATRALYLSLKICSYILEDLSLNHSILKIYLKDKQADKARYGIQRVTTTESYSSPINFTSEFKESFDDNSSRQPSNFTMK